MNKGLKRVLIIIGLLVAFVVVAFIIFIFYLGNDLGSNEEKNKSLQTIENSYELLDIPQALEFAKKERGCGFLDSCPVYYDYRYNYVNSLETAEVEQLLRTSFEKQGVRFDSPLHGITDTLDITIKDPKSAELTAGKKQLQVTVYALEDKQNE